jgi:hypothetical protein
MGTVHQLAWAVEPEAGERRVSARRRILARAAMRLPSGMALEPATIKDVSSTGLKASTGASFHGSPA